KRAAILLRCLHGCYVIGLLPSFLRQLYGVSAVAMAEIAQPALKPGAPGPLPILRGQYFTVIAGVIHPALSKDYFPRIHKLSPLFLTPLDAFRVRAIPGAG
ncbi:MAG: hypothetical protein ACXW5W_24380, partial [Candidatus Binatia bacterium]